METLIKILHEIGTKAMQPLKRLGRTTTGEGIKGSPRSKTESPNENKR